MALPQDPLRFSRRFLPVALGLIAMVAVACGSSTEGADQPTNAPAASPTEDPLARFNETQHDWTVISDDLDVVLATPDLGVGPQRFALVLSDSQGLIKFPIVQFESYRYPSGFDGTREGPFEAVFARFAEFPFGTRGIHVTELGFDSPGTWSVETNIPRSDGSSAVAEVRFEVLDRPLSVSVGQAAPRSQNRTLTDVASVADLTTGSFHDEELYRYTVAEALERQRPFVIVFASPAFCTNAVCGPQVEVVSELREQYAEDADFIHVDLFDNPQEIQGDLSRAIETTLLDEWGLVSQEWTYVVGADGIVTARFENFVGAGELTEAIESAIKASGETAGNA